MSAQSPTVRGGSRVGRIAAALLTPLAVVVLAYGLWQISDKLGYIGPLDRAAFGWAVVIPIWLLAPVAAGFAWRRLGQREPVRRNRGHVPRGRPRLLRATPGLLAPPEPGAPVAGD